MRGKLQSVPFDESPSSYYITMTVPSPPKIKIKIPKLTMQKRFHSYDKRSTINRNGHHNHDDGNSSDKRPKKARLGKLLTLRTVASIFTNAFGSHADENRENVVKRVGFGFKKSFGDPVARRAVVVRKRERAIKLVNASKRVMLSRQTSGIVGSLRRIGSKSFDKCLDLKHVNPVQEKNSLELCKKRTLMGSKCKALTASGALHYDKKKVF